MFVNIYKKKHFKGTLLTHGSIKFAHEWKGGSGQNWAFWRFHLNIILIYCQVTVYPFIVPSILRLTPQTNKIISSGLHFAVGPPCPWRVYTLDSFASVLSQYVHLATLHTYCWCCDGSAALGVFICCSYDQKFKDTAKFISRYQTSRSAVSGSWEFIPNPWGLRDRLGVC